MSPVWRSEQSPVPAGAIGEVRADPAVQARCSKSHRPGSVPTGSPVPLPPPARSPRPLNSAVLLLWPRRRISPMDSSRRPARSPSRLVSPASPCWTSGGGFHFAHAKLMSAPSKLRTATSSQHPCTRATARLLTPSAPHRPPRPSADSPNVPRCLWPWDAPSPARHPGGRPPYTF